jgi:hypothetical protein
VEGGALHADEFGGLRDVAAEAVDLGDEIVALEDFARVTQRHRHQMFRAAIGRE